MSNTIPTVRQRSDEPPAYQSVINDNINTSNNDNYIMPVIPNSFNNNQIQPLPTAPLPEIINYRTLPPVITQNPNSSQNSSQNVSQRNKNSPVKKFWNKKTGIIFVSMFIILIGIVGAILLVVHVVFDAFSSIQDTASGTSSAVGDVPVCNKGYAITDCDLECGLTYETNNYNRIVGGSAAVESSWPSAALVIFSYSATINLDGTYYQISSSSMCGGTLIDKSTVLSAAHCIKSSIEYTHNGNSYTYNIQGNSNYPSLESTYTVYLGVQDRNTMSGATAKSVRKIIKHASYDTVNTLNDIALFKLTSDVTLSNRIQVACLPEESENFPESEGITASYAAGWGTLSSGGSSSAVLRDVDLNIYGSSSCANVAYGYTKDWDKQICAGDLAGTKDTCQGDSGGPLYVKKTVGGTVRYYVVGITSYGDGCATFGKPAIYTRTSYYYDWIRNNDSQNLYMKMIPLIVSLVVSIFFRF